VQAYIYIDTGDSYVFDTLVLQTLLKDRTTNQNIIWATDDYSEFGSSFNIDSELELCLFNVCNTGVAIRPRMAKKCDYQNGRTRDKAEVFTPAWLCNEQNNLIDEQWFGCKHVFNKQLNKSWQFNNEKKKDV